MDTLGEVCRPESGIKERRGEETQGNEERQKERQTGCWVKTSVSPYGWRNIGRMPGINNKEQHSTEGEIEEAEEKNIDI